jgi:spore coat protein A
MLTRRALLAAGAVTAGVLGMPQLLSRGVADAYVPTRRTVQPTAPFLRPMPVAPVLEPVSTRDGTDVYRIPIRNTSAEILPGIQTPLLGFAGQFAGPTIRARTGRPTQLTVTNEIDVPVNVHLHGGRTPADSDGHPMDVILPGKSRLYTYPNQQQGTTLWYHDHNMDTEAEHVYRGLAGAYIIEDPCEEYLGLPRGDYDVPIMLRDIQFDANGDLVVFDDVRKRTTILANGVSRPYFPVAARKYRFRLINTANDRTFQLSLSAGQLTQIGTDGGLLPAPVQVRTLELSSAERADVVIDFSRFPVGTKIELSDPVAGAILRFDVTRRVLFDFSRVPDKLRELPPMPRATVERDVNLSFDFSQLPSGGPVLGEINGKPYDDNRIDFTIKRGTTEIWTITSTDPPGVRHTFHMHLVQFRVLDRNGKPPLQSDAGLKDTVYLTAGETVRVQATFVPYTGRYLYHCHFLEHAMDGMMAQMNIVP